GIRAFHATGVQTCALPILPGTHMNETRKQEIIGEAHFLRAFYHWMLAKNFGEIPVKIVPSTTEAEAYTPKSPLNEVYAQIYADQIGRASWRERVWRWRRSG